MSDIRDYVRWRGDLRFQQDPVHPVDALVFSALSYIRMEEVLKEEEGPRLLRDLGRELLEREDLSDLIRSKNDPDLLALASDSNRFGACQVLRCRSLLDPAQDTQFFAVTFLLDDGSAMIAFRGTDFTVVGWKEDFNMSFQQTVPAQELALDYVREVSFSLPGPIRICGHSKGGNLAVFSAARSSPMLQQRIQAVYNNDGPGFSDYLMGDPGYKAIVPVIHTFVPQSSIIGMLMDHEEPYTIIKSRQIGLMQHDVYNWEIHGPRFVPMEEITADSRFLNETIRKWYASMDNAQRNQVVDTVFGLFEEGQVADATEILSPRNIHRYVNILGANENMRKTLSGELQSFLEAARETMTQVAQQKELDSPRLSRIKRLKK